MISPPTLLGPQDNFETLQSLDDCGGPTLSPEELRGRAWPKGVWHNNVLAPSALPTFTLTQFCILWPNVSSLSLRIMNTNFPKGN